MSANVAWQVSQIEANLADGNELAAQEHTYHALYDIRRIDGSGAVLSAGIEAILAEDQGTRFEREARDARMLWAQTPTP